MATEKGPVAEQTLLHVGPFKTGTTVVQGALHAARKRLHDHGVHYAGEQRQALRAAMAVLGRPAAAGWEPPRLAEWTALAEEVRSASAQRVVVSSEFFSDADEAAAARIVQDLGGSSVHVAVTLRPLARIAPSHWQYGVQTGVRTPYPTWLEKTLADPSRDPGPGSFWRRQRHDRLVERWAEAAGADQVTVIVVDERDRGMLLRTFESLVGLPEGFLVPEPGGDSNRSLTEGEIELVRRLNIELERLERDPAEARSIRRAVVRLMRARRPGPVDRGIVTPDWALKRCAEIGAEMADAIEASGVRVIGDLTALGEPVIEPAGAGVGTEASPVGLSVEQALQAVLGAVHGARPELGGVPDEYARAPALARTAGRSPGTEITASSSPAGNTVSPDHRGPSGGLREHVPMEHRRVADVSAQQLLSVLLRRARRLVRRSVRPVRSASRR